MKATPIQVMIRASRGDLENGLPVLVGYCDSSWAAYWSVISTSFLIRAWDGKGAEFVLNELWPKLPRTTQIALMYGFLKKPEQKAVARALGSLECDSWHLRLLSACLLIRASVEPTLARECLVELLAQYRAKQVQFESPASFSPWRGLVSRRVAIATLNSYLSKAKDEDLPWKPVGGL